MGLINDGIGCLLRIFCEQLLAVTVKFDGYRGLFKMSFRTFRGT